ncbi:MAG TPA: M28 family metallopeptidase [Candidatus Angelobacter sp.]|jgi:Zn-dependent M28 family amino/carboxypeptidase|nr:M28 family metallopeptidase [Candidatus Angelobacter sp.]
MKKPLLLCSRIFIAILFLIALAHPQSPMKVADRESTAGHDVGTASAKQPTFEGTTWWNYVKILAADNMEGRETGSPGLRKAQEYVVEQLKSAGLEPVGSKSYYQPIRFESRQIVEKESSLALMHNGQIEPLTLGDDAIFSTRVNLAPVVNAPLVFAGYGLTIPELGHNDFADLNVRDKVVVIFSGAPAEIPGALASHYQSAGERWKALHKAGAVGIITILNPAAMDIPWSRISANRAHPSMALKGAEFDETAGEELAVTFNPEKAQKLFEGSGHTLQELLDLVKDRKPLPRFPLIPTIRAKASVNKKTVESANLVAELPGSDPQLKNEYVVLSAHLDHLGVGEPINGDRIYNGAMDNASGSAVLLDVIASLKKSPKKLKRSLLFVFVTAEEKGLLGSRYFTTHPTVKPGSMIANINIDMFLPIVPLKVLTVYGLGESDLGDMAREVAQSLSVQVQADPEPQRNAFIRSDQYNFIRHGVPALAMGVGFEKGSPEQEIFKNWRTQRYHAPSDDLDQPVDVAAAGKYEEIIHGLMVRAADDPGRPQWKPESFFRRYAPMASGLH